MKRCGGSGGGAVESCAGWMPGAAPTLLVSIWTPGGEGATPSILTLNSAEEVALTSSHRPSVPSLP